MTINRFLFTKPRYSARHAVAVAVLAACGLAVPLALRAAGYAVSVTSSLDEHFVKITPIAKAGVGDYVSFCRPLPLGAIPPGPCPDGSMPLVKRVIAAEGDRVLFTPLEIRVDRANGVRVIYKAAHVHRGAPDSPFPHPTYGGLIHLNRGDVVVLGDHPHSFDSRYFGVIDQKFELNK